MNFIYVKCAKFKFPLKFDFYELCNELIFMNFKNQNINPF